MFAPGIKIVPKNWDSYFVVNDSLCEPEKVEIWIVGKGFLSMPRKNILADIISGAYVTNVRHNVTSLEQVASSVLWCTRDCLKRWYNPMSGITKQLYDAFVQDILERVGKDLLVDIDRKNVTIKINDGDFFVEKMIRKAVSEVADEMF